jgi:hypothetical protein
MGFFPSGSSLRARSEAEGEAIQRLSAQFLDCFVAMLLAMAKTLNFPLELPDLTGGMNGKAGSPCLANLAKSGHFP